LASACSSAPEADQKTESNTTENYIDRYPNGIKKMEGKLFNGKRQGKWIAYYESGIKWSEGMFRDGLREGDAIVYYENGKKKLEGKYRANKKIGIWKVWEEDGVLVQEVNLDSLLSPSDSLLLNRKAKD